jgi:drug/metabolite transporter (DMT)-like permease
MKEASKAIIYTLLASFFWGTSFAAIAWGLKSLELDLYGFLFFAAVIAAAAVAVLAKCDFSSLKDGNIWVLGLMNGAAFTLQYMGQTRTDAGRAALLVNLNIVIVAVLSYFMFREKFTKVKAAAIPLAITGVFLLTTGGDFSGMERGELIGDLCVFMAGAVWAFYIVMTKREIDRMGNRSPLGFLAGVMLVTTVVVAVPMAMLGSVPKASPETWLLILYIAVFCTILAFLFWFRGLRSLSSTASCIILLFEPVVAVVLSVWLLAEVFTVVSILGAVIILIAIYLVARG